MKVYECHKAKCEIHAWNRSSSSGEEKRRTSAHFKHEVAHQFLCDDVPMSKNDIENKAETHMTSAIGP